MFRSVLLPKGFRGRLLLHSMPGRKEDFDSALQEMKKASVTLVVSLAPIDEVKRKSPNYHAAIISQDFPFPRLKFEIEDYQAPSDRGKFRDFVAKVRDRITIGDVVLIHCGAGVGRTGMFITCLLLDLGLSRSAAEQATLDAGSRPDRQSQRDIIEWFVTKVHR